MPDNSSPAVVKNPLTWQNIDALSVVPGAKAAIAYIMNHNALNMSLCTRIIRRLYKLAIAVNPCSGNRLVAKAPPHNQEPIRS